MSGRIDALLSKALEPVLADLRRTRSSPLTVTPAQWSDFPGQLTAVAKPERTADGATWVCPGSGDVVSAIGGLTPG